MEEVILRAENLRKSFFLSRGIRDFFLRKQDKIYAVDGISFEIRRGEILGLVGESGCGKTTTGWIIAGHACNRSYRANLTNKTLKQKLNMQ